jgi:hypothetical protein
MTYLSTTLRKSIGLLVLLLFSVLAVAQKPKSQNLPKFDNRLFHFGFALSLNSADMEVHRNGPRSPTDSLLVLRNRAQGGFNLGIVSSLTLYKYLRLRFVPTLTFAQRNLEYYYKPGGGGAITSTIKPIESTYVEFPLFLKLKSKRLNNFGAYLIAGAKYNIDLASNEKVDNDKSDEEIVIKFKRNTFAYDFGVGTDFYLMYFKFGIEAKMSYTFDNVFIQDNTVYSSPIEKIKPKMFIISFTFEG